MIKKEKILFIINPISGIGRQKKAERIIEKTLDQTVFDYEIMYTNYAHHATAISLRAVLDGFDTVVAVGGDGSINDCVKGLVKTDVCLGIIPAGSGNGLARHLQIPLSIEEAIKVINKRKIISIDTIMLNSTVYASIAGVGFDAFIAEQFAKSRARGFQTYFRLILQHYARYKVVNYDIEIDGQAINTDALFICIANSNQFGYNATVTPHALLDDGYIDVSIVKKVPLLHMPQTAQLLLFKELDKSMFVDTYRAKEVRILNNSKIGVNVDGEYIEEESDILFSIMPKSLKVIVP